MQPVGLEFQVYGGGVWSLDSNTTIKTPAEHQSRTQAESQEEERPEEHKPETVPTRHSFPGIAHLYTPTPLQHPETTLQG